MFGFLKLFILTVSRRPMRYGRKCNFLRNDCNRYIIVIYRLYCITLYVLEKPKVLHRTQVRRTDLLTVKCVDGRKAKNTANFVENRVTTKRQMYNIVKCFGRIANAVSSVAYEIRSKQKLPNVFSDILIFF